MKTFLGILEIIEEITYKNGWKVNLKSDGDRLNGRPYIQVEFEGQDAETGKIELQKCRKWFLSYHMTTTEIVYTVFKAIQAAEDHETREFFKYKNVRVVNPHFSVDDIVDMVSTNKLREDSRKLVEADNKPIVIEEMPLHFFQKTENNKDY